LSTELPGPSPNLVARCSNGFKHTSTTLLYVSLVSSKNPARLQVSTLFSQTIHRSRCARYLRSDVGVVSSKAERRCSLGFVSAAADPFGGANMDLLVCKTYVAY